MPDSTIHSFPSVIDVSTSGFAKGGIINDACDSIPLLPPGSMTGSADNQAGKDVNHATDVLVPCSAKMSKDGLLMMPLNTSGYAEDEEGMEDDYDSDDEHQGEADDDFIEPTMGQQEEVITSSDIQLYPDYVKLAPKMSNLTFDEVREKNVQSGVFIELQNDRKMSTAIVHNIRQFVEKLPRVLVWQLSRAADNDLTTKVLHPQLHEAFMPEMRREFQMPTHSLKTMMFAALEILALYFENVYAVTQSSALLSSQSFLARGIVGAIDSHVTEVLYFERVSHNYEMFRLAHEILFERRDRVRSCTRSLEDEADLSVNQKVEVFMNAVIERNSCGASIESCVVDRKGSINLMSVEFRSFIQVRKGDRNLLRELFESHPYLSPKNAIAVLDDCVNARKYGINTVSARSTFFYSTRGVRISFFCRNYDAIAGEVSSSNWQKTVSSSSYFT